MKTIDQIKQIVLFSAFVLFLTVDAETLVGNVTGVIDGDTITVLSENNLQYTIRLDKIDAPEKEQAFGNEARDFLARLVAGCIVYVDYNRHDRYNRIIGTVFCGGIDINLEMIKSGYAWNYQTQDTNSSYAQAGFEARSSRVGLWQDANPIPPWDFRKVKTASADMSTSGEKSVEQDPNSASLEKSRAFWAKTHDAQERAKWYASPQGQLEAKKKRLNDLYNLLEAQEAKRRTEEVRRLLMLERLKDKAQQP